MDTLPRIEEIIVVEGRDDTAAIRQAVDAVTIETHGFGIRPETWDLIETAYQTKGIIVFTDPDTAGEQIRRRILQRFPEAGEAFLDRSQAEKAGDIGIENASPANIREALAKVHSSTGAPCPGVAAAEAGGNSDRLPAGEPAGSTWSPAEHFTPDDLFRWGLDGAAGAAGRRRALGQALGLGYATSKTFLQRLNRFGIPREEIERALDELPR